MKAWAAFGLLSIAAAAATTLEVHELEAAPERYLDQDLVVLGRFRSAAGAEVSLVDSQIVFRVPPRSPAIRNGANVLEFRGRLAREGNLWVFTATEVSRAAADRDEFAKRRRLLMPDNWRGLIQLSRWARQRAQWYDDAEVETLATTALRDAIAAQRQRMADAKDAGGLLSLAEQARAEGLENREIDELRHQALALKLDLAGARRAECAALADEIAKHFPQAAQASDAAAVDLDAYWKAPVAYYARQDDAGRRRLERALWAEATARATMAAAEDRNADLAALVARARKELPDRPDVVSRLELAAARAEARQAATLSRGRLLRVAEELRRLQQPEEAESALRAGLAAERMRLPVEDAEGRVDLAESYVELLSDRATAAELYLEAWSLAPQMPGLPEKLSELGYTLRGGVWRPPQSDERPSVPQPTALQTGASESDVEKTLGKPNRIARVITGSGVTEQWIYEGPPRLDVYMRRAAGSRGAKLIGVRSP